MADKIKFLRVLIFIIVAIVMLVLSLNANGNVETDLLKTFLSKNIPNVSKIIKIANNNSSVIKIVYETEDENGLYNIKEKFLKSNQIFCLHNKNQILFQFWNIFLTILHL